MACLVPSPLPCLIADRDVRRVDVERQSEHRLAGGVHHVLYAGPAGRLEHVVGGEHVVLKRGGIRDEARCRDGAQVHDGVETAVPVIQPQKDIQDLSVTA